MGNVEELEVRLDAATRKCEAIGKAMESARIAFESIKYLHRDALSERSEIMDELLKAMREDG